MKWFEGALALRLTAEKAPAEEPLTTFKPPRAESRFGVRQVTKTGRATFGSTARRPWRKAKGPSSVPDATGRQRNALGESGNPWSPDPAAFTPINRRHPFTDGRPARSQRPTRGQQPLPAKTVPKQIPTGSATSAEQPRRDSVHQLGTPECPVRGSERRQAVRPRRGRRGPPLQHVVAVLEHPQCSPGPQTQTAMPRTGTPR